MKNGKEKIMQIVFLLSASISMFAVGLICYFLFANGVPAIFNIGIGEFLGGRIWRPANNMYGIFPMIVTSIIVTIGAVLIGAPLGIFTAVYLGKFASPQIRKLLKPVIDLLAGIPSVIYGFFGLVILVPMIRTVFGGTGNSLLAAIIVLAIMILPTIISVSEAAIRAVPDKYYQGALALGASHERSTFIVVVRAASQGIISSLILGVGRAIGETMAVIMVIGNQTRVADSLLKGARTLTGNIALEMGYATDLHREALIATGVVLFVFILVINIGFSFLKRGASHAKR